MKKYCELLQIICPNKGKCGQCKPLQDTTTLKSGESLEMATVENKNSVILKIGPTHYSRYNMGSISNFTPYWNIDIGGSR